MEVLFYHNMSDNTKINKTLQRETEITGELRSEINVMEPVIRFTSDAIYRFNYCYVPDFQRYYSISSIDCPSRGIYDVSLKEDVLMSFRGGILLLDAIIERQTMPENSNSYIDDSSLVCENVLFNRLYNFPAGFNEQPTYILVTAG